MNINFTIQLFEGRKARTASAAEREKLYLAVGDMVPALTDTLYSGSRIVNGLNSISRP